MIVVEPLLKKPEADKWVNMSESWLEKETAAERIPCIHFGSAVRYDVADLRAYIESKKITLRVRRCVGVAGRTATNWPRAVAGG